MMTLDLDLGPSKAKLARAREHAEALKREATKRIGQETTHAVEFSPIDPQTGWCSITLIPQKIEEPRLQVILGDVIHNLRCALDYLIPPLIAASNAKLSTTHEFPIKLGEGDYAAKVGSKIVAKGKGPLRHVVHGLSVVEAWQPYNAKGDPETDPLWGVHRFSNADKHRQLATFGLVPLGRFEIKWDSGIKVEDDIVEEINDWEVDHDIPVGRIRFDPPYVTNLRAVGRVKLDIRFITPRFGKENKLALKLASVDGVVDHVAKVVDSFRDL
jgi:hypothetical protein